jgi:hypothetical protein
VVNLLRPDMASTVSFSNLNYSFFEGTSGALLIQSFDFICSKMKIVKPSALTFRLSGFFSFAYILPESLPSVF